MAEFAESPEEVEAGVMRYAKELNKSPGLAGRLSNVRSWYAVKDGNGKWHFGPSKFVGYMGLNADSYLNLSNKRKIDGRKTEEFLSQKQWFQVIATHSDLHDILCAELTNFLSAYGKTINKIARINVRNNIHVR